MSEDSIYLIDHPTPYCPREEWEEHLAELEKIPDKTPQIEKAIQKVKNYLQSRSK